MTVVTVSTMATAMPTTTIAAAMVATTTTIAAAIVVVVTESINNFEHEQHEDYCNETNMRNSSFFVLLFQPRSIWAAFNKANHSREFSKNYFHFLKGYCKPVSRDIKLESSRYSLWRDLILDRINFIIIINLIKDRMSSINPLARKHRGDLFKQSSWILLKMFVLVISRSSSKLGHLGSKTRSVKIHICCYEQAYKILFT